MTVRAWPETGDSAQLGAKARGLMELSHLGLPVPPAVVLRGEALTRPERDAASLRNAAIDATREFFGALHGARRAVSLRCAEKGRTPQGRLFPESVLDLGISDAPEDKLASEVVCEAHASAFFAFFGDEISAGFARLPLRDQLEALLTPLLAYLAGPALPSRTPRSLVLQQMVYGDRDARSLTGICYTRNPHTGATTEYGHILVGHQGMALGAIDDPRQRDLSEMRHINPVAHAALIAAFPRIESHYGSVRKLEFTAEGERLFLLQNTPTPYAGVIT
jgi:pyruvate,orthophosphate dikinase